MCRVPSSISWSPLRLNTRWAQNKWLNKKKIIKIISISHKSDPLLSDLQSSFFQKLPGLAHGWGEKLSSHPGNKKAAAWWREEGPSRVPSTWDWDHSWCSAVRWRMDTLLLLLFLPFDHPTVNTPYLVMQHCLWYTGVTAKRPMFSQLRIEDIWNSLEAEIHSLFDSVELFVEFSANSQKFIIRYQYVAF